MRILISEFMDAPAVESLRADFDVAYLPDLVDDRAALLERVADADALIVRNRTRVDGDVLAAARRLRVVGRLGVGLDNIDVDGCGARGIRVFPATGANSVAVAEYVITTAMMLLRGAYASSGQVAAGAWPRAALSGGREAAGKTLGLIGFGGIGRTTARLGQAIGMKVLAFDPHVPADESVWIESGVTPRGLDALLDEADVVSLHVPLTDDTRSLLDAARIARMRPGAVLINSARGGIVDESALVDAVRNGRLGGAAIDVFDDEPLPARPELADVPNLILTPHVAGVTRESSGRVGTLIAALVGDFLKSASAEAPKA